jgi:hypothetical protein
MDRIGEYVVCSHCGYEYDPDFLGVELYGEAVDPDAPALPDAVDAPRTGGSSLDWLPCCEGTRDDVAYYGFEAVFEVPLEVVASSINAGVFHHQVADLPKLERAREVVLDGDRGDSVVRYPLRGIDPGKGVSRWRDFVFADVEKHHRHHGKPGGWKVGVAVYNGPTRVGVAVLGRPNSRMLAKAEPRTLEVTRVCTWGDRALRRNAASKLYALCARRAREEGATKLISYTIADVEDGASLKASGFVPVFRGKGGSWSRKGRERKDGATTAPKIRWEKKL